MIKLATFSALLALSLGLAACARHDRRCVLLVASTLCVNWVLFSMPWIYREASMAYLVSYAGGDASQADCWAALDAASLAATCYICRQVWWAPIIWSTYLTNLTMYVVADVHSLQYTDYASVLDVGLCVQLAVIYAAGGPGVQDRVSRSRLFRRLLGLPVMAFHLARGRRG